MSAKATRAIVRPTEDEIEQLLEHFRTSNSTTMPLGRIIRFAIATAMRQDEIHRVDWEDFNARNRTLMIRDRKDPRNKRGNHQRILFEAGFTIEQVSLVTGHKDWKMLRRCTHLKPEQLHDVAARLQHRL